MSRNAERVSAPSTLRNRARRFDCHARLQTLRWGRFTLLDELTELLAIQFDPRRQKAEFAVRARADKRVRGFWGPVAMGCHGHYISTRDAGRTLMLECKESRSFVINLCHRVHVVQVAESSVRIMVDDLLGPTMI